MRIAVLDAATLGNDLDLTLLSRFGSVECYPLTLPEQVKQRLADVECAIVNKVRLDRSTIGIGEAPQLKLICIAATGYDNVDISYMKNRGIAVCNVVGYSTDSVAQITLSMVLSLASHLKEYREFVASGSYSAAGAPNRLEPVYHELSGKTWGVVGLGNIGRKVAAVAAALGCRVLACKRTPDPSFQCADIDELCRTSDIITVHTPLTDETRGLINAERIASMKPGAIVVNSARGAVWDEDAVCSAVLSGKLGGIGADVYSTEPFDSGSPFWRVRELPNVCLTPHMAWGAYEARVRCLEDIAMSIEAFQKGILRSRLV